MPAQLDSNLIDRIVTSFPKGKGWKTLHGNVIGYSDDRTQCNWMPISNLDGVGGVYAFLFPRGLFWNNCEITLDGPRQRQIPFRFSARGLPTLDNNLVVYVGKASDLLQRFQWHFRLAEQNTGAQVQHGLVKSKLCRNRPEAVRFMIDQATLAYHLLPGDEHAANRDIIEVSLCARFRSPFNIKSEH